MVGLAPLPLHACQLKDQTAQYPLYLRKNLSGSIGAQMAEKKIGRETVPSAQENILSSKTALRQVSLALRGQIAKQERDTLSGEINRRAATLLKTMMATGQLKPRTIIHLFRSFGEEVETGPLLETIREMGFGLVVPVVHHENSRSSLLLSKVGEKTTWKAGPFQIPEPDPVIPVSPDHVSLFFLPGLAFDRSGNRLGYGKGYYDQLLSGVGREIPRVALAFSHQVIESVPSSEWDVPMTMILTEKETIDCD